MKEVMLKNGSKEADTLVAGVMMSLRRLFDGDELSGALAVYELHEKCKNPDHEIFGTLNQPLEQYRLIDSNGTIHGSIRNIVLSAVEGDGMEMTLGSPVAK